MSLVDDPPMAPPPVVDDSPIPADRKAGWSSWCRREAHGSCSTVGARCSCSCHGPRGQEPPPPPRAQAPKPPTPITPVIKEPAMPGTQTPPQPRTGLQCSECVRDDFLTPHALSVHMARTHKVKGATKGPREGKPGRPRATSPAKAKAAAKFDPPPEKDLELDPPPSAAAATALVVRRETPAGPELRLLAAASAEVVELLEWLGVATMPVSFGEG